MKIDSDKVSLLDVVHASLERVKAVDLRLFRDDSGCAFADYVVIVSGNSVRHVRSIAEQLMRDVKGVAKVVPRIEGMNSCNWVLVDVGDVVIHVFRPEVRSYYMLDRVVSDTWTAVLPT